MARLASQDDDDGTNDLLISGRDSGRGTPAVVRRGACRGYAGRSSRRRAVGAHTERLMGRGVGTRRDSE
jgi:hypothetical protein